MTEYADDLHRVAYHAALNVPPCPQHWEGSPQQGYETCIGCRVDAAVDALNAADLLIPEGSDTREDWGVRWPEQRPEHFPDTTWGYGNARHAWTFARAYDDVQGTVVRRRLISTPPEPVTEAAPDA